MSAQESQADRLARVAALSEPLRRRIYLFVAAEPEAVSRDQAAERFGVSRAVAAFHLDKLADVGMLDVDFKRPRGKAGPGAGRPAKLYRAAAQDVSFSFPPREYEMAGRVLAEAVSVSARDGVPVQEALHDTARMVGHTLGRHALVEEAGDADSGEALVDVACDVLSSCAYEPLDQDDEVVLLNCPFHALAEQQRDLVCGMNLPGRPAARLDRPRRRPAGGHRAGGCRQLGGHPAEAVLHPPGLPGSKTPSAPPPIGG